MADEMDFGWKRGTPVPVDKPAPTALDKGMFAPTTETVSDKKRIEEGLDRAARGFVRSIGEFTVTTGATTTTVEHYGFSSSSCLHLDPLDANAALEFALGTTYVLEANRTKGQFVVTHPSNANVRKYRYTFWSGLR